MSYNDYPGCSDSYDSNESPERTALDEAIAKRDRINAELTQLANEGDGYTVLGQFFARIDDARFMRGLAMDRRFRDVERLDAAIAALMTEIDGEFPVDVGGYDPDAVIDAEWS